MKKLPNLKKLSKIILVGIAMFSAAQIAVKAQVVDEYTIIGQTFVDGVQVATGNGSAQTPPDDAMPVITPVGVTNSDLTIASGLTGGVYAGFGYAFGATSASGYKFGTDATDSVSKSQYITFTVTPSAGTSLDLTSLDLSAASFFSQEPQGDMTTVRTFEIQSSVTGFGDGDSLATIDIPGNSSVAGPDITLGSAFSDLTGAVEFRIIPTSPNDTNPYDAMSINSNSELILDGLVTTDIPEPTTYALMGIGLACLVQTVRKNRSLGA
jgi:hypothetical protein